MDWFTVWGESDAEVLEVLGVRLSLLEGFVGGFDSAELNGRWASKNGGIWSFYEWISNVSRSLWQSKCIGIVVFDSARDPWLYGGCGFEGCRIDNSGSFRYIQIIQPASLS